MAELWSEEELEIAVEAYLWMLVQQRKGKKFVKKHIIEGLLATDLGGRTRGAIEMRWMNISSILYRRGEEYVQGYKPYSNVGRNVIGKIEPILKRFNYSSAPKTILPDLYSNEGKTTLYVEEPPSGNPIPQKIEQKSSRVIRDPLVKAFVYNEANGFCVGCQQDAPFLKSNGKPYLDVHHLVWLSKEGPDTVENSVALCPNCHQRCHHGHDREEFTLRLQKLKAEGKTKFN